MELRKFVKTTTLSTLGLIAVLTIILGSCNRSPKLKLDNPIFPFNNAMRSMENAPKETDAQARLLQEIGFTGMEAYGSTTYDTLRGPFDKYGLKLYTNYIRIDLDKEQPYDEALKPMIEKMSKGEILELHLHSNEYADNKKEGDKIFAEILTDLADFAAKYKVQAAVYPHVNFYCETVEHSVELAKMVNRPNFGAIINLCHMLKVEGSQGIIAKIDMALPYLKTVSICGADDGDTREMGWDKLIQPLGEGSFDVYEFIKTLKDKGYNNPIGIQCFNIKGDVKEILTKSLKTWKEYQARYENEKN